MVVGWEIDLIGYYHYEGKPGEQNILNAVNDAGFIINNFL